MKQPTPRDALTTAYKKNVVELSDSAAEEIRARMTTGGFDDDLAVRITPKKAGHFPATLLLPPDRLAEQQAGGTWSEMFNPQALQNRYHALPFLHEMGLALRAADLVVSRAGASALGEYPLFGLPAILVPYPFAWRYQKVNADHLAARGAAVRLNDEDLAARLQAEVRGLLADPARLARMRSAARAAARPDAAGRLAREFVALAGGTGSEVQP